MTDKELIKQEIESYKESMKGLEPHSDFRRGQITAYNQIMQFIDSLPEEHNEDLEEELDNFLKDSVFGKLINRNAGIVLARHFAEWQRKKDQSTIELAEDHAMLAGMEKMREEMMKDAVIAWVNTYESVTNPYDNEVSFITNLSPSKFKNKETVRIIIVKED